MNGRKRKISTEDRTRPLEAHRPSEPRLKHFGAPHHARLPWRSRRVPTLAREALLAYAPGYLKPVILCALNTGLRRGELLSLTWADLDLERRSLRVRPEVAKNRKPRQIPINHTLQQVLGDLPRSLQDPHVFLVADGTKLSLDEFRNAWEGTVRRCGVKNVRFHDLRHTFASRLVQAGASLQVVKELLGHRDYHTTLKYAHLSPEMHEQAVALLDRRAGKPAPVMPQDVPHRKREVG